jgi:uncharacterized protein YjhX (UPF0386 family)
MKGIYSTFIILLLFISITAQKKITDREFDGFKGKVESVITSYSYFQNIDGKETEKQSGAKFEIHYDQNGNITQTLNYVVGDKNIYSVIEGNKTFKTNKIEGVGGYGISSNSNGINKQKPRDERYSIKFEYKYDEKDRVAEESLYSNNGSLISKTIYKYDKQGRIEEVERYNSEKIASKQSFKIDNKNVVIEELLVFPNVKGEDGITKKTYSDYKFDAQGNWTERTQTANYKRNGKTSIVKTIDHQKINYYEN